jgi:hypothetical protein
MKKKLLIVVSLLLLSSCKSLDQELAVGYGTNTLTRRITTDALIAQKIDVSEAEKVLKITDNARALLDIGYSFRTANTDSTKYYLRKVDGLYIISNDILEKRGLTK